MRSGSNIWAVVLAAGDGKRLGRLTTANGGRAIPKQYCSLWTGPSLLHDARGKKESRAALAAALGTESTGFYL